MNNLPRPLPVRPRPRPGDTTATYARHLADANHLPEHYLRRCLSPTLSPLSLPDINLLAAFSGRTPDALRNALAGFSCAHCGTAFPDSARRSRRWCSPACNRAATPIQRTLPPAPTACRNCGTLIEPTQRNLPRTWCSPQCRQHSRNRRRRQRHTKRFPGRKR